MKNCLCVLGMSSGAMVSTETINDIHCTTLILCSLISLRMHALINKGVHTQSVKTFCLSHFGFNMNTTNTTCTTVALVV